MVSVPFIRNCWINATAYAITATMLDNAERDARAAGLTIGIADTASSPFIVPPEDDAVIPVLELKKKWKRFRYMKISWAMLLKTGGTPEAQADILKNIIDDKCEMTSAVFTEMMEDLDKIFARKVFVYQKYKSDQQWMWHHGYSRDIIALNCVRDALIVAAKNYAVAGDEDRFFTVLQYLEQLAGFYLQIPGPFNRSSASLCYNLADLLAIMFGSVTPSALPYYQNLLDNADKALMVEYNSIGRHTFLYEDVFRNEWLIYLLLKPAFKAMAVYDIRHGIDEQKLLELAQTTPFFEAMSEEYNAFIEKHKLWYKFTNTKTYFPFHYSYLGYAENRISTYFNLRQRIVSLKLGLVLKIYRIEHGAFPEKLSELVPGTIPEVPINPFTGKELLYKKNSNDSFTLRVSDKYPTAINYMPLATILNREEKK